MKKKSKIGIVATDRVWLGADIRHLVLETADYVVFLDKVLDVDWQSTSKFDKKGHKDAALFNSSLNTAAIVERLPCKLHSEDVQIKFKRMIGEGIARALSGEYVSAHAMFEVAQKYINDRNLELSRFWYLSASGWAGLCCAIALGLTWVFRDIVTLPLGTSAFEIFLAFFFGGIGALLSIIFRIGKVKLDCHSGRALHYLEGTFRIVGGAISGMLVAILLKSGILFSMFSSSEHFRLIIFGLALIGGASESLAPSLVSQFDAKSKIGEGSGE